MTFAITRLLSIVIVVRRPLVDPDALLKPPSEPALKTNRVLIPLDYFAGRSENIWTQLPKLIVECFIPFP